MKRLLSIFCVFAILCSMFPLLNAAMALDDDTIVALEFNEHEMTWDAANGCWTSGVGNETTLYRWGSYSSTKIAIRKFVVPATEELTFKHGAGFYVQSGTAKFVITDKDKNIIYPEGGGYITLTETPHVMDTTLSVTAGDELYFIGYDFSVSGTCFFPNTSILASGGQYDDLSGYLFSDANIQGDKGWYYIYATDIVEVKRKDYRDMTALNEAIAEAEGYTPDELSSYTTDSVNAFNTALTAAKAITKENSQTEIDAAATALNTAIAGLTPKVDPDEVIVALDFDTHEMTYDSANGCWTSGADNETTLYRWGSYSSTKTAIRKFVVPATEELTFKHGAGFYVQSGTAKFVITDKDKNIIYPEGGGYITLTETPHVMDTTMNVTAGDELYFIGYDFSVSGTCFFPNTSILASGGQYDDLSGYLFSDANIQGDKGWYYIYATDIVEVKRKDYRDMTALNEAIAEAEGYTPDELSGYTTDSVNAFNTALTAAKAITKENSQTEIDSAAATLNAAIDGLTVQVKPEDVIVALDFTEHEMTWDAANSRWTAGAGDDCVSYRWGSVSPAGSEKVALRKFVVQETGELKLKWGTGFNVAVGTAKFVITDKHKKIIYPANGGYIPLSDVFHALDLTLNVEKGDVLYFIAYDFSTGGVGFTANTAAVGPSGDSSDSGNLFSPANVQGDKGWYYTYATDLVEIKQKDYKTLDALNEQIAAAEGFDKAFLDSRVPETVAALQRALAAAKAITKANTQAEIDAATATLKAAIKGLKPLPISSDVKKVAFTEKRMTFDSASKVWFAGEDTSCYIIPGISVAGATPGSGNVAIRKLVVPQTGDVMMKWGGVYVDNTSGLYTGASAQFMITDKDGNILYPTTGGAATVTEGKTHEIDITIPGLARGDALYFITCNPSTERVPLVFAFLVSQNGQMLSTDSGFLYGIDGAQGAKSWYYMYADDFRVATAGEGGSGSGNSGDSAGKVPGTGDSAMPIWPFAVLMVASTTATVWLINKKRKGVW